jgi:diguanylate cyclase (GGDEF)-like protein
VIDKESILKYKNYCFDNFINNLVIGALLTLIIAPLYFLHFHLKLKYLNKYILITLVFPSFLYLYYYFIHKQNKNITYFLGIIMIFLPNFFVNFLIFFNFNNNLKINYTLFHLLILIFLLQFIFSILLNYILILLITIVPFYINIFLLIIFNKINPNNFYTLIAPMLFSIIFSIITYFYKRSHKNNFFIKLALINKTKELEEEIKKKEILQNILEKETLYDTLTTAYNRKALFRIFDKLLLELDEDDYISFNFLDIDNLKKVNDTQGHPNGDKLIKEFVRIISSEIRNSDYIFRIGGDEFVLIITKCTLSSHNSIIERITNICKDNNIRFSIGSVIKQLKHIKGLNEILKESDNLMYQDKKITGRNTDSSCYFFMLFYTLSLHFDLN